MTRFDLKMLHHFGIPEKEAKPASRSFSGALFNINRGATRKRAFETVNLLFAVMMVVLIIPTVGCVVGPDFAQPSVSGLTDDFLAKRVAASGSSITLSQWWQQFNDSKLNSLLQQAQSQNLSLRESYERVVQARANVCLQSGQLNPNGNLTADYSYRKNSQNARQFVGQNAGAFNLFELGADASWEIDLFGKIRRSIEAADAELAFEQQDYEFIRQTLFADIVSSYLNIRLLQSQVRLIEDSLSTQTETLNLVSQRMEAGVSTELDRTQTESFQHRTNALLALIRQQVEIEFNNLGLLLGQAPDIALREFVGLAPLPAMPPIPHMGLPAELLRRRPDVMRQEMAVRAASARIGIAEADLYPQLSLLGTIAVRSTNISGLFETAGLDFDIGPSFSWNIFHFGRIFNNIEIQQALLRQSIARYQDTVLSAVREVEDAIVNHQGNVDQFEAFNRAAAADEKSVQLSLERYRAGKANFQRVLDAQQQLLNDQRQGFVAQTAAITQLVRLYRALGGGWELGSGGDFGGENMATSTTVYPIESIPLESVPLEQAIEVFDASVEPMDPMAPIFNPPVYTEPSSAPIVTQPAYNSPVMNNSVINSPVYSEPGYPLGDDIDDVGDEFTLDFE